MRFWKADYQEAGFPLSFTTREIGQRVMVSHDVIPTIKDKIRMPLKPSSMHAFTHRQIPPEQRPWGQALRGCRHHRRRNRSRVKAVIMQVPFVSGNPTREDLPGKLLADLYHDSGTTKLSTPPYMLALPRTGSVPTNRDAARDGRMLALLSVN